MFYKTALASLLVSSLLSSGVFACDNKQNSEHGMSNKSTHQQEDGHKKMHLVKKIVNAVSKAGLNTKQLADISNAINTFKVANKALMQAKEFPIDALKDDKFDTKLFVDTKKQMFDTKMHIVSELFESVYTTLDSEQKKIFKREFTAPIVKGMIKKNMVKPGKDKKRSSCN